MPSKEKVATPIIGRGEEMRALRALIATVANSQATVLISGESGTGKELIARALHDESDRAGSRFVPVNCAAIPRELVEAELFGHRKGAFTGAVSDRVGRFELAHGGTLFLDEIGDLPLDIQVKLLRVLQERAVDPVGAMKAVEVDVRVVAASHKDLEAEVKAGRFREDLFYRLNVLPLQSPPLRRRVDDIPELAAFHAKRLAPKGRDAIHFSPDMLLALKSYNWPGNVRELINLVDRFTALFPGQEIGLRTVPAALGVLAGNRTLLRAQYTDPEVLALRVNRQVVRGVLDTPQHQRRIQRDRRERVHSGCQRPQLGIVYRHQTNTGRKLP